MKVAKTYVCLVDNHRRPSRQRNTKDRYLVGAKTPKEAIVLLQTAIGFGSIQVHYCLQDTDPFLWASKDKPMNYKQIVKVTPNGYEPIWYANSISYQLFDLE